MARRDSILAELDQPKLRQSVTFSRQQHDSLSEIADQNNVSLCWVVRYACDLLIQNPERHHPLVQLSLPIEER